MQFLGFYLENSDWVTVESDIETTTSFIATFLNIIACSFVFTRLYSSYRRNGATITGNTKYPLYFCISYFLYAIMQVVNLLIDNSSFSQPAILSGILGKFSPTFLTMNLLLIGFLEFSTSMDKKVETESGSQDVYIWNGIFLLSWVASIFGINRYEQLELRYALRLETGLEYHFNVALIFSILISTVSYFFELRKNLRRIVLRGFVNDHTDPNTLRSILFCIIPFLIQWSSILFYNFAKLIGNDDSLPLNVLLMIAVNTGGIGHAISYFIYEQKYVAHKSSNIPTFTRHPSYGAVPTIIRITV